MAMDLNMQILVKLLEKDTVLQFLLIHYFCGKHY